MQTVQPHPLFGRLRSLIGIEPGEEARVGKLTALYTILVLGVAFVETIAFTLFLREFGSQNLPYAYVATAVLAPLAAFSFLQLGRRVSFHRLLISNATFLIIGCTIFWMSLRSSAAHWAILLLPAWFQTQIILVNLAVWPLAGRLFDVRQSRRLFGLVGTGTWIANIVGGFIVAPLVALFGADQMLLIAAIVTAIGLWLMRIILRTELLEDSSPRPTAARRAASRSSSTALLDRPIRRYIRLILAYVFLWWVAFFFLDNIFYDRASVQFQDTAQLARAIGLQLSAAGVLALITSIVGIGYVMRRYGLQVALLAMPVVCGVAVGALAIAGNFGQTDLLFWLAVFARLINVAWGFSLSQSALVLSYQPLPSDRRGQIQTLAEGIVQPIAIGVAGLALLGLNTVLGLRAIELSWFFVGIITLLCAVIVLMNRQYPQVLSNALARRQWGGGTTMAPADQASLNLLRAALHSPHPATVIYGLDMLERADPAAIGQFLPELLRHHSAEVRRTAFARVEGLQLRSAAQAVQNAIGIETEPTVRGVGLQALAALVAPHALAQVVDGIADPHPQIQCGALVGLLRYGGDKERQLAQHKLLRLAASYAAAERILAAQILAELGMSCYREQALGLLADQEADVRREALKMAAKLRDPQLWPAVIHAGAAQGTTRLAVWALAAGGEAALPAIEAALTRPALPQRQTIALVNACGRIRGELVVQLLANKLGHPDHDVRTALLEALSASGYRATIRESVHTQIRTEAAWAAWVAAALVDIGDDQEMLPLQAALTLSIHRTAERLCLWLSFLYDAPMMLRARKALAQGQGAQYAYALELLDTQLPAEIKNLVLPIAEDLPPHERLRRLAGVFPQNHESPANRLNTIIGGSQASRFSPWVRVCALFAVGSLPAPECLPAVRAAVSDDDALVRETAIWVLARLDPAASGGDHRMLSTIEKVLILKQVDVFQQTPDDVLADVAALLEEIEVAVGETIFHKGDLGDSLYIIITGKLRVDDADHLLNYLDENDVFGEMALLDAEPRVASVRAVEPTHLLRLDHGPFYELIADRPEVAIGLIRVLTGRLRARVRDVTELNTKMAALPNIAQNR
jgi:ATP:ADP antiporter, AAA family